MSPVEKRVMSQDFLFEDSPHVPVSYTMIVKGNPDAVERCLDSVYGALFCDGCEDEGILVDTGSSDEDFEKMKALADVFPNLTVVDRRDLSVDYAPLCDRHLSKELAEQYKEYIGDARGILSFSEARNIALSLAKNEIVFWLDSDDILAESVPGQLRAAVNNIFGRANLDQLFLDYEYEFGVDGTCTTRLRRERFFRKSLYEWVGNCHETAIPRDPNNIGQMAYFAALKARIVHTEDRKPHQISDIRNYLILREEFERTKNGDLDPRTVFYLGNSARGLKRFGEALQYYDFFDAQSGSQDDRFAASYYRAGIFMEAAVRRPLDALDAYFKCVEIKPFDPRGYYGISRAYLALARPRECVFWYGVGGNLSIPDSQVFSHDPTHVDYHPHVIAANAYKELEDYGAALECARKAYSARPTLPEAREQLEYFANQMKGEQITQAVGVITSNVPFPGGMEARRIAREISKEMAAVPPGLEKRGINAVEPPDPREKAPTLAFFCGGAGEPWDYTCRQTGIGGSEKMVILLAEKIQALGVNVTVYGDVLPHRRGLDGNTNVMWRHWSEFDNSRPRDAVVFWRSPESIVKVMTPAKKRMIWNHDVQNPARYTPDVLALADFVQLQSKFHAEPLQGVVPAEKLWIARNAIEPTPVSAPLPERNPKRVVYSSSPDRGLYTAACIVERAKKIDPEIEFVVTYGVTPWARKAFAKQSHRFCPDLGRDVSMDLYERACAKKLQDLGAVVLHRIGFEQMRGLLFSSGVWLYPTRFPEISCMSAMEAQEAGCVILATRFGALEETIFDVAFPHLPALPSKGDPSEEWLQASAEMLVEAVNVPEHGQMRTLQRKLARRAFGIEALAKQWIEKLGLSGGSAATKRAQATTVQSAEPSKPPVE